jgi:flagellar assembly factor FliW
VVINLGNRIGRQIVLVDERYSHRQPSIAEQAAVPAE